MARSCDICGKQARMGNSVEIRGKAKYLGGVGTKVTGITRRQFKPNLQRVRVTGPNGGNESKTVCTQCLRSGAVRKAVRRAPFQLPPTHATTPADTAAAPQSQRSGKAGKSAGKSSGGSSRKSDG